MCSVTVVSAGETVQIACNRDEQRSRPAALPPRIRQFGLRRAILPVDPVSEGTWVGVNDAGLALTLLNVHARYKPAAMSRGKIIPALLHTGTPLAAAQSALKLDPARYAPFRLVLVNHGQGLEVCSDGVAIRVLRSFDPGRPEFFTSSGLGDALVDGPRRQLFSDHFCRPGDRFEQQRAFHRHSWAERRHLSVCMEREDARTVSHTVVSLGLESVTLTYHPEAPDRVVEPVRESLSLQIGVES